MAKTFNYKLMFYYQNIKRGKTHRKEFSGKIYQSKIGKKLWIRRNFAERKNKLCSCMFHISNSIALSSRPFPPGSDTRAFWRSSSIYLTLQAPSAVHCRYQLHGVLAIHAWRWLRTPLEPPYVISLPAR